MKSYINAQGDGKDQDVPADILGVHLPVGSAEDKFPVSANPSSGGSSDLPNVRNLGVAEGRVARNSSTELTAIEKANLEADEVRERFKNQKTENIEEVTDGPDKMNVNAKKYDRRLKMNRRSAAASRVRKEAYITALERQLRIVEKKYTILSDELKVSEEKRDIQRSDPSGVQASLPNPEPRMSTGPEEDAELGFWSGLDLTPFLP